MLVIIMPTVYLRKDLYDLIARRGEDVNSFVNRAVEKMLKEVEAEEKPKRVKKNE
jgi:hypothetical protein